MTYELLIETSSNVWMSADIIEQSIPIVFQLNDIGKLENRQASYSQSIGLPITPNNCQIFDFVEDFNTVTRVPYIKRRCQLKCDGITIVSDNYRIELNSIDDKFNCQIVNNIFDIIGGLKDKPMSELGLENIVWDINTIIQSSADDNILYKFPATASQYIDGNPVLSDNLVYQYLPHIPLLTLVEKSITNLGYTFETNVTQIPGYLPDYIAISDPKPDNNSFINNEKTVTGEQMNGVSGIRTYLFQEYTHDFLYEEISKYSANDPDVNEELTYGFRYAAIGIMSVQFRFNTSRVLGGAANDQVKYRISSFDGAKGIVPNVAGGIGRLFNQSVIWESPENTYVGIEILSDKISLSPGELVYVEAILLTGTGSYRASATPFFDIKDNNVIPGGIINPNNGFTFKNQSELLLLFSQLYCTSIEVDTNKKIVRALTFDHIRNNVINKNYVDWSNKIDIKDGVVRTFEIGSYGQKNNILKKANAITDFTDSGNLSVQNDISTEVKDLFTLSITSTNNINFNAKHGDLDNYSNLQVANMPLYVSEGESSIYNLGYNAMFVFNVPKLKWSKIGDVVTKLEIEEPLLYAKPFLYHRKYDYVLHPTNVRIRYAAKSTPIQYYIDTFYGTLVNNLLNNTRVIEAYFNITPIDIQELDMFKPVYIDYFKEYFYIQKINNYVAGELTQVTLVCLNISDNG